MLLFIAPLNVMQCSLSKSLQPAAKKHKIAIFVILTGQQNQTFGPIIYWVGQVHCAPPYQNTVYAIAYPGTL